ncbi:MAG: hypothetical protein ABJN26_25485 [Stappiaceae bacterium]
MLSLLRQREMRRTVFAALLLPLVLFSFFSVGTMPVFSKQGIDIVICTGDTFITITVDENGQPIEKETKRTCDWSLPLVEAVETAFQGDLSPVIFDGKRIAFHQSPAVFVQTALSTPHARGPPLLSV